MIPGYCYALTTHKKGVSAMKLPILTLAVIASVNTHLASPVAHVDHIEDDSIAVIQIKDREKGSTYEGAVPVSQINGNIRMGARIPVHEISARCADNPIFDIDGNIYYRFDSESETWTLSNDELDIIPRLGEYYSLFVSDNGTTSCTHGEDCECYIYDDFFICVKEMIPW